MSNCRCNRRYEERRCNHNKPARSDRRGACNNSARYDRSDVMGGRRFPTGGEPCNSRIPRAWQNSRYDRP